MIVVSVMAVAFVYQRGFYAFLGPVVGGAVGAILNVVLGSDRIVGNKPIDPRIPAIVTSFYVVAFVLVYRTVLYTRPIIHYALFGGIAAFVAYQIWAGQPRRQVLPQIVVIAFLTYWSTQFTYPAGVISPDSGFVSISAVIAQTGTVPTGVAYQSTPAHMIYVAESILIIGLSEVITYQFISVCALLTTILFVGSINRPVPRLSSRVILYAALIFAVMSFTLRRGMFPDKTNFFKPIIMILLLSSLYNIYHPSHKHKWALLAVGSIPVLVFGHTYSTGAALLLVGSIWGYHRITSILDNIDYTNITTRSEITILILIIFVSFTGYSLVEGGGFVSRGTNLFISLANLLGPTAEAGGSGGGRYSTFSLRLLFFSTAAQALLFALSVLGIGYAIRKREWSLDAIIVWIAIALGLLGFSAIGNAVDIPTPRIYFLIGIFGLNIMAALGVSRLAGSAPASLRQTVVIAVTFVFVIFSLASPVGSVALSPVSDEIPDKWRYQTAPDLAEQDWADEFGTESLLQTRNKRTEIPLRRTGAKTVGVEYSSLSEGTTYEYRDLARDRGVSFGDGGAALGTNIVLFLTLGDRAETESVIYRNGKSTVYMHQDSSSTI